MVAYWTKAVLLDRQRHGTPVPRCDTQNTTLANIGNTTCCFAATLGSYLVRTRACAVLGRRAPLVCRHFRPTRAAWFKSSPTGGLNHGLPRRLPGRPAGISLVQIVAALVNSEEFWLMLEGMFTLALLFWNVGSGKLGKACERMQAAALR